jgi:histidine triad (HIT) family protein
MPAEEAGRLFQVAAVVAGKVQAAMGAAGFNLGINNGKAAGQEVFHVHIHIIPRYPNDGGGSMKSVARMRGEKDLEQIAATIRQTFSPS